MENLREQRQKEFADIWLKSKWGVLLISPRMGKTRIAILALQQLNNPTILIAYPDMKIKKSWEDEFEIMKYDTSNVTYTTYLSLHKYQDQLFDIVILDEIHATSKNQLIACYELLKLNRKVLALTGTLDKQTQNIIRRTLGLQVIAEYPIEKAIEEGVLADYEISIIKVPLDNKVLQRFGKKLLTEKKRFDNLTYVIDQLQEDGKDTKFLRLMRMRVFQGSIAKIEKTKEVIDEHLSERLLVFTGLTKVADSLQIPSFHSKCSDKSTFNDFINGDLQYLAVVKIGNQGITYKPLNRVIVNFTDSNPSTLTQRLNRCMSMEYDNPNKKALISIISSDEKIELAWIKRGLSFFDSKKIKYL